MACPKHPLLSSSAIALVALCRCMSHAYALPEGGVVRGGSAVMVTSGNALDVTQGSDKAIIDWRGFDIGSGEKTEFHQPRASSVAINRVTSTSTSQIDGSLKANGNVVIINQNGIAFGKGAKVDVNSLIATTADASNDTLMRERKLTFDIPGNPDAGIVNEGTITAKDAGLVGLVAPNVMNAGTITAKLGRVQLASGDTATVDFYGDGLMKIAVSDKVTSQLVANTGEIKADGGTIALTAAAGAKMVNSLIDAEGHLQAQSVAEKNGEIIISAEGSNAVAGNVAADKGRKTGTSTVLVQGILDASGRKKGEHGGKVSVFGDNIALLGGTIIDVSGDSGKSNTTAKGKISDTRIGAAGGDVKIGGDYLGSGTSPTAKNLYVDQNAYVLNDSLTKGDAGRTIFWSDGKTHFQGNVFARALGGQGVDKQTGDATAPKTNKPKTSLGNGGFVETSGDEQLDANGYVNLTASDGERGTYFLDPANIAIYGNVDPKFQSTDGSIDLLSSLKLWLDASDTDNVNLTYSTDALGGATVTGVSGSNTITTSVNVASSLAVGARIRLGAAGAVTAASTVGADTYTIAGIAGTTITLSSNLTTNYNGGAGNNTLYRGLASQLTDKSGQGNHAIQGTQANMPMWISNGQNGLGVAKFDGNDYLLSNLYLSTLSNNVTLNVSERADSPSLYQGLLFWRGSATGLDMSSSTRWGYHWNDNGSTWGWTGGPTINVGNSQIVSLNVSPTFASVRSNGSNDIVNNVANPVLNDSTTPLRIGLDPCCGGRYFIGRTEEIMAYNKNLSANENQLVDQYQSSKWNIGLTPPGSGASEAAQATASIQKGDAVDGYSAFSTRYLERLSQSANIALQANNNITLDLKGDNLNFTTAGRSISLTAGNQITTASAGSITTNNAAINFTGTSGILFNHAFALNSNGGTIALNNATTLNANLTTNSGSGTTTFGGAVNGANNLTATAGTFSFASALGGATPLSAISLTSTNSLTLPSINAGSILAQATGATSDITVPVSKTLTATGAGNAITLAAGSNFINSAGASALSNPAGRWLIYSTNPTNTLGEELLSPASNFNRYNCTYTLCNGGVTIPVTGNGLVYSFVPTLTVTGITASKPLDGNRIAPLIGGTIIGALAGDTGITLNGSGVSGMFSDSIPGTGKLITLTGAYALGGTNYGYQLIQPAGITGTITLPASSGGGGTAPEPSAAITTLQPPVSTPSPPQSPVINIPSQPLLPAPSPAASAPSLAAPASASSATIIPNTVQIVSQIGINPTPVMPLLNTDTSAFANTPATVVSSTSGSGTSETAQPVKQEQGVQPEITLNEKTTNSTTFGTLLHGLLKVHPVIQKRFKLDQTF